MTLLSLSLTQFRNHAHHTQTFDAPVTLFVGPNATGKTSFLEAIRCLSLAKSFRARSDRELIQHETDFCRVEASIQPEHDEPVRALSFFVERSPVSTTAIRKRLTSDGRARSVSAFLGTLPTVLFTPDDLSLLYRSPSYRRAYLDGFLCQFQPAYYTALLQYKRVLRQRNQLLQRAREFGQQPTDELDVWDQALTEPAQTLLAARETLVTQLNERLTDLYQSISQDAQATFSLSPEPTASAETFLASLQRGRERDIHSGSTRIGPHRDDYTLLLSERSLSAFGSRGEQRSGILALKLAELHLLEQASGQQPLLLLDDLFSELDVSRQQALLRTVANQQTIITTTDADHVSSILPSETACIDMTTIASSTITPTHDKTNITV